MKNTYKNYNDFCRDFTDTDRSGQRTIVNGWDCTFLPQATIDAIKDYDSIESLVANVVANGQWLPKFRMILFNGIRFEVNPGYVLELHVNGQTLLEHCVMVEGCHAGGEFMLEPLRRADDSSCTLSRCNQTGLAI